MGVRDWIASLWSKAAGNAVAIARLVTGETVSPRRDYGAFANEGYRKNVIAFRSISLRANSIGSLRWTVYETPAQEKELPDHELAKLLRRPNPMQGGSQFFYDLSAYFHIAGNSYVEAVATENGINAGVPQELWVHNPSRIEIMPDKTEGMIAGFREKINNTSIVYDTDQMLHWKSFNPLDDWYGMSAMEAAVYSVNQHNAAGKHNFSLLKNGARPAGMISLETKPGAPAFVGSEQIEHMKEQVEKVYGGPANAGRPFLAFGGYKWTDIGMSLRDMDFGALKKLSAREIATTYGVPPILTGMDDATFANYKEARLSLWEDAVIPEARDIRAELNNWLAPKFGDVFISFDEDAIPAIVERREAKLASLQGATFLTANEKREAMGYEKHVPTGDPADELYQQAGVLPLSFESEDIDISPDKAAELGYGKKPS